MLYLCYTAFSTNCAHYTKHIDRQKNYKGGVKTNIKITDKEINRFVAESNAIEGIFESAGHPLVIDHIKAVRFVLEAMRQKELPEPRRIHKILLKSEPQKNPGEYRIYRVTVGRNTTPLPHLVPSLMEDLLKLVLEGPKSGADIERWMWDMHCEFECIHPFIDGNGRVGRLWMNAMRLIYGLPWLTVLLSDREAYYHRISVFRWEHCRQYAAENPAYEVETLS